VWPHADENMDMVGHAVYLKHFVLIFLKDAGNKLMQSFFPFRVDKGGPVFYGEYKLDVDLGVAIRHGFRYKLLKIVR
jgi:hypothetical protein